MSHPVAIVGLGCVLPDAPDVDAFWDNLTTGRSSIREVPPDRWDPATFYNPDKSVPDRTYAKIGAFVDDHAFNGLEYRMPPKIMEQVDPSQRWALSATRQALKDAGYATGIKGDDGRDFDRDRCAVIVGNAMGGETNKIATKRLFWPDAQKAIQEDPDFQALPAATQANILARAEARYKSGLPEVTEDTMPGHLSNVVAGRIANVFDLSGKNFTTDAACASSLAALDAAVQSLASGEADMVIWGGSDRSMDITPYIQFSKIGALSPDGSRPFDKNANGFVMGEGCAMFVLKRAEDAERDGDHVYAVVRGIGSSSDGKGKGITAPNPAGQVKAVRRAYQDAGVEANTIGYLEAHGTSTPVGDPVELQSVEEAFKDGTPPGTGTIRVGSVKSNIGHLKAAAGAAGVLKTALAIDRSFIPPSINVQELNPRIAWSESPFQVATQGVAWDGEPRRAAVSSFGFGGTNFHVVLEQYQPGTYAPKAAATNPESMFDVNGFQQHMKSAGALEAQSLVLDADQLPASIANLKPVSFAQSGEGPRVRDLFRPLTADGVAAERRVGLAVQSVEDIPKKLELAKKAAENPAAARLAFNQGVFIGQGQPKGKIAFLFPGQGTQYVNMCRDLAAKYEVVANTFAEADQILFDDLGGIKLTDILWPTPDTEDAQKASNEKLKLTEFTQPAVLAADVALLRLLDQWGIKPDVVAGHSLGEYGALVAAGVLSFADALHAVAARGREMATVDVPDLGKMASVSADWTTVEAAIKDVNGYVIPANKNCPSQTVIAGSSAGVDEAVAKLQAQNIQVMYLPVSAAFHSDIVAPASKPLRRVLGRLDVKAPKVRILSNVGAKPYPDDPEAIRDNLAIQVASPVEWIGIMERMADEGVTTFIEVGPKRALTGFAMDILKDRAVAICSNHPKKGGIQHVNELFAFLGAWGYQPRMPDLNDAGMYTPEFRDPTAAFRRSDNSIEARLAALEAKMSGPNTLQSGAAANTPHAEAPQRSSISSQPTSPPTPTESPDMARVKALGLCVDDIAVSGISVGLPGRNKPLFDAGDWDRILNGENLIDPVGEQELGKLLDKNINKLVKDGGQARFEVVNNVADVIRLAGQRGDFDIAQWGVPAEFAATLDRTFQYAIAAGLEALNDAGIPLQQTYKQTSTGSYLPKEWKLPEPLRRETGIVFASAFPGYDNLIRDISRYLADKYAGASLDDLETLYAELRDAITDDMLRGKVQGAFDEAFASVKSRLGDAEERYQFNRKFLFSVLSMGHAQLAQFIGAQGPNTQLNAACASTTQGIAVAQDWIRTGRCRRVLVVGADDVTSDAMFEWVGSGFLASGAATTQQDVTQAALPFDARRHGMIIGMGAVGLVVEAEPEVTKRGMRPVARLLASRIANSAFHGSRLDVEHIAHEMAGMVEDGLRIKSLEGTALSAQDIANETVFMSHETYTPARGGSASAEIHALRHTFGASANKVVVANTKGFTGHPQGAGVEDALVLKCLQRGRLPPIANFRDPDPELGDLNLSKGGDYDVRYALRLAAGFGSQIAMTLTELVARENERVANQATYEAWLNQISGLSSATVEVANRTLRIVDQGPPSRESAPVATPAPVTPAPMPVASADPEAALAKVTALVADKTGYPPEMLEADLDMEADLGIDTVKQAELFGELREMFGVPLSDDLQLKDYNTLRKVADYMVGSDGQTSTQEPAAPAESVSEPAPAEQPTPSSNVLDEVVALVAEKTGYPAEMLEPDLDMEADLGIDTVKQAELFGELRERYGVPLSEDLQLKDYNTLAKVAAYMGGNASSPEPAAAPAPIAEQAPEPTPDSTPESTPATASGDILQNVIDLVADKTGYPADMLEPDLDMEADLGIDTVKQAEVFGELRERFGVPMREDLQLKDYNTLAKVAAYMADNAAGQVSAPEPSPEPTPEPAAEPTPAPVAADAEAKAAQPTQAAQPILRRIPVLRAEPIPAQSNAIPDVQIVGGDFPGLQNASNPKGLVYLALDDGSPGELFELAKANRENLEFITVITKQDGAHGLSLVRNPNLAAVAGVGKSLKKEFPNAVTKVIDLHPSLELSVALDEMQNGGTRTEIAYGSDGTRYVVDVAPEQLEGVPDVAGKAFIVSGGAQGITVELLAALAPQQPKFLLLGRTKQPEESEAWSQLDDAGWKAMEATIMQEMKDAGEKVTPVTLQKALSPRKKAAEVYRNLERLSDLGAEVLYAAVDVTDAERVGAAITWAKEHLGEFSGVIHAAGLEISKDIASKDREQFDLVYGIKHNGFDAIMNHVGNLDLLACFGSVAGRFGNLGQPDYAAANEYLAKATKHAAVERGIKTAFTIAWGPWGEVGMATRGSIMQIMEASGVTPIPTQEGVRHFLAEMATPGVRESVVAGKVGAIDADHQVVDTLRPSFVQTDRCRLLSGVESRDDNGLTATVTMDKAKHAFAADHAIDGVPYYPGVFGLESFAEAIGLMDATAIGFDDVKFAVPFKQLKDNPATAQVTIAKAGDGFDCRLESRMVGPDGNSYGDPRLHFSAHARIGAPEAMKTDVPPCTRELAQPEIYPPFFHGPSFQVLKYAEPDACVGIATHPDAPALPDMTTLARPMLVEAMFQICGLRTMATEGRMSLPASIAELNLYDGAETGEMRVWGELEDTEDGMRYFAATAASKDGTVLATLRGYGMVDTGEAPAMKRAEPEQEPAKEPENFDVTDLPDEPEETAEAPHTQNTLSQPPERTPSQSTLTKPGKETVQVTLDTPEPSIPTQNLELDEDGMVVAAVAVDDVEEIWFSKEEWEHAAQFPAPKRREEWLAGRLAAKAAVQSIEPAIRANRIQVHNEEGGLPYVVVDGQRSPAHLTITHRGGMAIAAVSDVACGIDLELIEERKPSFLEQAFTAEERQGISQSSNPTMQATCAWAAKEAVFKRIGTGLKSKLHDWTVAPDEHGGAVASGPDGSFGVRFYILDDRVLAVTAPVYDVTVSA